MRTKIEEFELIVICTQDQSFEVLSVLKELDIEFEMKRKVAFAPISPEVSLDIIVRIGIALFVPVVTELFKRLYSRHIRIGFETRFEYAQKALADKQPLVCEFREDRADYSRYIFKTRESMFFWEFDRGNIRYGRHEGEK